MHIKSFYKKLIPEKVRLDLRVLIHKVNSIWYFGNKITCNCCNKNFNKFLSYGDSKKTERLNAQCPWCQSLERTRMLWDYLKFSEILKRNIKILHFGPTKILEEQLKKLAHVDYLSADINPVLAMDIVDITNIQYTDNTFNLIICGHILSDVKEDFIALKEMKKVLKNGGTLILLELILDQEDTIEDPSIKSKTERLKKFGNKYSVRCYGKDFAKRITSVGFEVTEYNHLATLSDEKIKQFGLQNSGILYLCNKN